MIGHLKDVFPEVPTLALSVTITPTVLEYIRKSLKLRPAIRLYRESLDRPNITYLVEEIVKPKYENLAFLVPNGSRTGAIPKTMIFVDNIDEAQCIAAYLRMMLPSRLQGKRAEIIRTFSSNLESATRTEFLRDFRMGNTQIWICTECAGMGLNLPDIVRAIQWKIPKHCTVADMLQRLGMCGRNGQQAVALIFVEKKHILPDGVDKLEGSDFVHLRSPVKMTNKPKIQQIVSKLYEHNL